MAPAAKKGSKKVQSFVVDCTRPVRVDSFARIVFASKSEREKDAFFFVFSQALLLRRKEEKCTRANRKISYTLALEPLRNVN